jgi:hypothetical protein
MAVNLEIQDRRILQMPRTRGGHDQTELVRLAISGIDAQIRELEEKRRVLSRLISAGPGRPRAATVRKVAKAKAVKRAFSDSTRKRLSLAAKRRWARARAEKRNSLRAG